MPNFYNFLNAYIQAFFLNLKSDFFYFIELGLKIKVRPTLFF